ncbi:MAG: PKD domain-containing protein, partial [Bacteroidota bacterium]
ADFVAAGGNTVGCKPFEVDFVNNSSGFGASQWDFGNGGTSIAPNPTFVYPDTGLFTVTLNVIDQFGCIATQTRTDYIEVLGSYPEFIGDPLEDCPGSTVQFTDLSTAYANTNVIGWEWDFGDPTSPANNSTLQNPDHLYEEGGLYTVSLAILDDQGCRDTLVVPDYINITFPQLSFTAVDSSTCSGAGVQFINNSVGADLTYQWDFGDGVGTDSVENPVYPYDSTGFYTVTLIGVDRNGCTDTLVRPQAIFIEEFTAEFTADSLNAQGILTSFCPPLNAIFRNQTVGNDTAWQWSFGTSFGGSFLEDPGFTYFEPGAYGVTLIATHEDGCQDTVTKDSFVIIGGPRGDFQLDPNDACLGDSVCLTALTSLAVSATIDFRDGTTIPNIPLTGGADTLFFCHLYTNTQQYNPAILLEDAAGCVVLFENKDSTTIHALPVAALNPVDTTGCSPLAIQFTDLTIPGDTSLVSWDWQFGGGNSDTVQNPLFVYTGGQVNDGQLVVTDAYGCKDSTTFQITTLEGATANFEATDTTGCAPETVSFVDLSTGVPILNWTWIFGDGDTLDGPNPNPDHLYGSNGSFDVSLIITDDLGCTDTLTRPQYINLGAPSAIAYLASDQVCSPGIVQIFGDSSSFFRPLDNYQWCVTNLDTGSEDCVDTKPPVDSVDFTIVEPGQYAIRLILRDVEGCTDTSASISLNAEERIVPDPIELIAVSVQDKNTSSLLWNRYPGADFISYRVIRIGDGAPAEVITIRDQDSLFYFDQDLALDFEARSYCYKILVENDCGELSDLDLTPEHCTIDLSATPNVDAINLDWTAYVGFTPSTYQVYRVEDYSPATVQLIASLPGTTTSYVDRETFCRDSISYRVEAIGPDSLQVSFSDIAAEAPIHEVPTESVNVSVATVVEDSFISVTWNEYTGYRPVSYFVERSLDGLTWIQLDSVDISVQSFTDFDVNVDNQSYRYRIFATDVCEDTSREGRQGKTMVLAASLPDGQTPALNWNPYQEWLNGVANYQIEIFDESTGLWEVVAPTGPRETAFQDQLSALNQPEYCYRIRAFELGGENTESLSNEDCAIFGPKLFLPNIFTPNNDGENDEFLIGVTNIEFGELSIYSQWGELIFQSQNVAQGWNGEVRNTGRQAPEGVYVYKVVINGFEGTELIRSGTVTLVR